MKKSHLLPSMENSNKRQRPYEGSVQDQINGIVSLLVNHLDPFTQEKEEEKIKHEKARKRKKKMSKKREKRDYEHGKEET